VITFETPLALAGLVLPLVVAWLAARRQRAPEEPTGTVELWRNVASQAVSPVERRTRPPLALWLLVAALVAGILALSGPKFGPAGGAVPWRFVVDRSPSMYLDDNGKTRLEVALEELAKQLGTLEGEWLAVSGRETCEIASGEFPSAWARAPAGTWAGPEWASFDAPGTIWVTDGLPSSAPLSAGFVASGGPAVPGVVAVDAQGRWSFDGRELVREDVPATEVSQVAIDARLREGPLGRALEAWARARGYEVREQPNNARLVLELEGAGELAAGEVSGPGFRAPTRARAVPPFDGVPQRRLVDLGGECVARATFGRIRVGFEQLGPLEGDDAAFLLAWAREFDEWTTVEGISASERAAAGERNWKAPRVAPEPTRFPRERALLAGLAALLALAALVARRV
jgi:hypothetical protein